MMVRFRDNAMFLQSMRQRLRPANVIAFGILTIIILALVYSSVSVSAHMYISLNQEIFTHFLSVHLFLLLAVGSWHAYQAAARERAGGTLDFHRASPTPAFWQMAGLLFGSTSLEWLIFLFTLPISLFLALQSPLGLMLALEVYLSVGLCAVLFHLTAIFFGFIQIGNFQNKKFNPSGFIMLFLLFNLSHIAMVPFISGYGTKIHTLSSHVTCSPVVEKIYKKSQDNRVKPKIKYQDRRYDYENRMQNFEKKSVFFNLEVNPLILQLFIQLPLFWLLAKGVMRQIKQPHMPPFSKEQQLLFVTYIFILFFSDLYIRFVTPDPSFHLYRYSKYKSFDVMGYVVGFGSWAFICGLIGTYLSTPHRLVFLRGLRKSRKIQKPFNSLDDHNSNFMWLMYFSLIVLVFLFGFRFFMEAPAFYHVGLLTAVLLLQIMTLAGAWETFTLSRFGSKPILFLVGLSILWGFLPMFGSIYNLSFNNPNTCMVSNYSLLNVFSPFYLWALEKDIQERGVVLFLNLAAALLALSLAAHQRRKLQNLDKTS